MGILDRIKELVAPTSTSPSDKDVDHERAAIETTVADYAHTREDADRKIAAWEERTQRAMREYKPGLIDPLEEARRNLGRPIVGERGQ